MYNDNKSSMEKAIGAVSVLSDPNDIQINRIALMYGIPTRELKKNIKPVPINGRIIYVSHKKAEAIESRRKKLTEKSIYISKQLAGIIPYTYTNKKHAREIRSVHIVPERDLTKEEMRRKVIADLKESKKKDLNNRWNEFIRGMKNLKKQLIKTAQEKFGKITPCLNQTFDSSFSIVDGKLIFWFNTEDHSTHTVSLKI